MSSQPSQQPEQQCDAAVVQSFDWEDDELLLSIVEVVASVTGVAQTDLAPLGAVIDTDALESLFSPTGGSPRTTGCVQFEYEGCLITVETGGEIAVVPPEKRTDMLANEQQRDENRPGSTLS